jgi:hypothetical protein
MKKLCTQLKLIRLSVYPLSLLLTTPIRLIQTLLSCLILADGKWGNYPHCQCTMALNATVYWVFAHNFYRFGRKGKSTCLGLGEFPMSFLAHNTLLSLYAYWACGVVVIITGMFGWWLSHFIWLCSTNKLLFSSIVVLTVISTTFYANIFVFQNYNALGWIFFPIGIYGLLNENWTISLLAWLGASFASTTVVFLAGITSLILSIHTNEFAPILTLVPSILKLSTHFWPNLLEKNIIQTITSTAKSLGLLRPKSKYNMKLTFSIDHLYYIILYSQFILTILLGTNQFPLLTFTGLVTFLVNSRFFRFADPQSIHMFMMSLSIVEALKSNTLWILPSYWLLISPLPLLLRMPAERTVYDVVPRLRPFSVETLFNRLSEFIKPVNSGSRVLMLFNDPKNEFGRLFDGYRILVSPLQYIASLNNILIMPDYWAINEMDYQGAKGFWGRDPKSGIENLRLWNADFLITYTLNGSSPDPEWNKNGFSIIGCFNWENQSDQLHGIRPYSGPAPAWWLLKPSKSLNAAGVGADSRKLDIPGTGSKDEK